jgi:CRP-like cAMP-binding protein
LRSTVERGVTEAHWLDQNADLIQILVVQNYLFFGNAQSVLMYIMTMFEDEPAKNLDAQLPPKPKYLVVDFTTLPGMDVSAVDTMREILQLCKDNRCKLYIAGLSHDLKAMLLYAGVKPEPGAKRWSYVFDLESALAKAEDGLISDVFHLEEKDEAETGERRRVRSQSLVDDGFIYALQKIDEQHGTNTVVELASFAECTRAINLEPGGVLIREGVTAGLYFVETGLMRVQRSAGTTTVGMNNLSLADPNASIGHLNARSGMVGRQMAIWKAEREGQEHNEQTFRLARIGQGWIIGDIEVANGMKKPGIHVAISECRLHQLPFSAITEAEQSNPMLAMHLYKFLSHLSTKRQEMTIEQLGQHLRILNSPVPRLQSGGRSALARIQNPLYHQ